MTRYLKSLLTLFYIFGSASSYAEPVLWLAQKGQQQLYLFGSVHLAKPDIYPLPSRYLDLFDSSVRLVIETDVRNFSAEDQKLMLSLVRADADQDLQALLGEARFEQLQQIAQQLGLRGQLQAYQPWYLAMLISMQQIKSLGYRASEGLDLHFIHRASDQQKRIVSLETPAEQIHTLSSLESIELELLTQTIDDFDKVPELFGKLIQHWQGGNHQALYQLLIDDPMYQQEQPEVINKLLFERNRNWMETLSTLQGRSFIVVGALHLYGEQGLLTLLKEQDFSISEVTP